MFPSRMIKSFLLWKNGNKYQWFAVILKLLQLIKEFAGLETSFVVCLCTAKEVIFMTTLEDLYYGNILLMQNGNIIEQGNHVQLLAKNGAYAELYNSQFA